MLILNVLLLKFVSIFDVRVSVHRYYSDDRQDATIFGLFVYS